MSNSPLAPAANVEGPTSACQHLRPTFDLFSKAYNVNNRTHCPTIPSLFVFNLHFLHILYNISNILNDSVEFGRSISIERCLCRLILWYRPFFDKAGRPSQDFDHQRRFIALAILTGPFSTRLAGPKHGRLKSVHFSLLKSWISTMNIAIFYLTQNPLDFDAVWSDRGRSRAVDSAYRKWRQVIYFISC